MLSFYILVNYVLEDLYYIVDIMMDTLHISAIQIVGLAVGTEHQQPLDYHTLHNSLSLVELSIFPNALSYQFNQA